MPEYEITDANGYTWKWNGHRVYIPEADEEFIANGDNPEENGYPASCWENALALLTEYGYFYTEDIDDTNL